MDKIKSFQKVFEKSWLKILAQIFLKTRSNTALDGPQINRLNCEFLSYYIVMLIKANDVFDILWKLVVETECAHRKFLKYDRVDKNVRFFEADECTYCCKLACICCIHPIRHESRNKYFLVYALLLV